MKIFKKEITNNGRVHIYFCGIKIASYKNAPDFPVSVFESDIMKHKAFMQSENIKTIVLGSSHGRDGFVPNSESFNLANSSQDLCRAYSVYKYITAQHQKCKSLKNIVLFWSVFHPGLQLEKTKEYLRCIPYKVFYNAKYSHSFPIKDAKIIKNLREQYKKQIVPDEYKGQSFYDVVHTDITSELVEKHIKNTKRNNNQIKYLKRMAKLASRYGHNLCIVLPPYRSDYLNCLPDDNDIYSELFNFLKKHHEIKLLNFEHDNDFDDSDFDSADHCNINGARKLTMKINAVLYPQKTIPTKKSDLTPDEKIRQLGVNIGKNVRFIIWPHEWSYPDFGSEPYLISIDDDTCISFGCTFVTHDASIHVCEKVDKKCPKLIKFGKISIGKNCFIGCRCIILPNVTIGDNCIVGAGSLVNKSIPSGQVWAGTPAHFIMTTKEYTKKCIKANKDKLNIEAWNIVCEHRNKNG